MKEKKLTPISELGLLGLIQRVSAHLPNTNSSKLKGIGDDAAVTSFVQNKIATSSVLFTEGVHFNLMYYPLKHLGYKAIVAAVTDIYAMNALPKKCLVNVAVSSKFFVEHIDDLFSGIHLACEKYDIELNGIDINSSLTGLVVSVHALGEVDEKTVVFRNTAKPNDVICATGNYGAAYMGLQVLERESKVFESTKGAQPMLDSYKYIIERQLKPEARKETVTLLSELNIVPTSMTAVNDGLASSLMHICNRSGVGCKIFAEKVPIDQTTADAAEEMNLEPLTCALNGGEDYELVFTISITDLDKILPHSEIKVIGHIVTDTKEKSLIFESGSLVPLRAQGWSEE